MILKGRISFDKKNLPGYIFKFNVAMVVYLAAYLAVYTALCITIGLTLGDDAAGIFTVASTGVFLIGVLAFFIIAMKFRERLVSEKAAELKEKFADMPLEEAKAELIKKGIITEDGFVCREDVFGKNILPFGEAKFSFLIQSSKYIGYRHNVKELPSTDIKIHVCIYGVPDEDAEEDAPEIFYELDRALFNFLDKSGFDLDWEDNKEFVYLKYDKENLCRKAYGFRLK